MYQKHRNIRCSVDLQNKQQVGGGGGGLYQLNIEVETIPESRQTSETFQLGKGKGKKKINVCKYYADGQCNKGDNCGFLHMSEEAAAEYARECKRANGSSRGSNSDK